ncbi:hypothetical protein FA95DRAFT_1612140 [Auriscalpium vulgare]|uniref:Uncharacterized protein n=1 Tax=Auriscalpium vulgare TaxID=40419 RepID=A0ACB8R7X0_9AGAM|nr:hypothetical protein FA95DRAFT_1612140 [Auriscalpium vulgare]
MSKKGCARRRQAERKKQASSIVFTNILAYANGMRDPERTYLMHMDEQEVEDCLADLRAEARKCNDSADAPDWRLQYADDVTVLLNKHLAEAKEHLASPIDVPLAQYRLMHTHRRIISGLHQEIELHRQGSNAIYWATVTTGRILDGTRVCKTAFLELYGF